MIQYKFKHVVPWPGVDDTNQVTALMTCQPVILVLPKAEITKGGAGLSRAVYNDPLHAKQKQKQNIK